MELKEQGRMVFFISKDVNARIKAEALELKAEGQKTAWYNPLTGRGGEFTINAAFRSPEGRPCKRLTQKVLADGQAHVLQSVACQRDDDSWGGFDG